MRADTAAAYVDEKSVEAFLAACERTYGQDTGKLYPAPRPIEGKGHRWLIEDLDAALDRIHGRRETGDLSGLV
jgi:hypothetical protein